MAIGHSNQISIADDPAALAAGELTPGKWNGDPHVIKDAHGSTYSVDQLVNASTNAIFVDPVNGLDTNTGMYTNPVKTIAHALTIVRVGGDLMLAAGTYKENNISINSSVNLIGVDPTTTIINGQLLGQIFMINAGICLFKNLTIENGKSPTAGNFGGGIQNNGILTVDNCTFSGNNCTIGYGGGIANETTMYVKNSIFTGNTGLWGGGIFNDRPSVMTLDNCSFTNNAVTSSNDISNPTSATVSRGAGIFNLGSGTLNNCIFTGNTGFEAVGIGNYGNPPNVLNVNQCTFSGNVALSTGAAIDTFQATTNLNGCIFTNNTATYGGGALYLDGQDTVTLMTTVNATGCIFIGNISNQASGRSGAGNGGAIYNYRSALNVIGCYFNANTGTVSGGAIMSYGSTTSGQATATSVIGNSTFNHNTAPSGGAILANDSLTSRQVANGFINASDTISLS